MFETLITMFSFPFMQRALLVGCCIALCSALLGVSLVLKRFSMIGDSLSHVGFGALAVATALNWAPMKLCLPVVTIAAFLLLRITESGRIKGDSALALISTSALAIGVIAVSVTTGMNTDINNYLFGSILAMSPEDARWSFLLCMVVLVLYLLFYHNIFTVTFDETFARATGVRAEAYNMLIALLTALTIVLGMRMMGSLLISALIIFPSLTAMRISKSFFSVIITAAAVSLFCMLAGLFCSYVWSTPAGASVVATNLLVFGLFSLLGKVLHR